MNDHRYFEEKLSAFADHELAPDLQAQVGEHVEGCAECRSRLEQLRQLAKFVSNQTELAETDYWEQSARKIEAQLPPGGRVTDIRTGNRSEKVGWWWKLPAVAASVLIVGYIGLHQSDILNDEVGGPAERSTEIVRPGDRPAADQSEVASEPIDQVDFEETEETKEERQPTVADESDTRIATPVVYNPAEIAETPIPSASISDGRVALPDIVAPAPSGYIATDQEVSLGAESGQSEPEPLAASPQDNYKRLARIKSVATATVEEQVQEIEIALADESNRSDSDQFGDDGEAGILALSDLNDWRHLRDSLQAALPKLAVQQSTRAKKKDLGFEATSNLTERSRDAVAAADKTARQNGEASLAEAWYQICRLTDDSSEYDEGIRFLRRIASGSGSASRPEAASYLKLLGKQ